MKYLLLGLVQGLTEFLPISSQGHLLVFERLFHLNVNLAFDTVVHLGTALAALIYFRQDILEMFSSQRRLLWLAVVATVFTGVLGLAFKDFFESLFASFQYVGPFFIVTGLVILLGEWLGERNRERKKNAGEMNVLDGAVIGLAQGLAIIPSLSRSAMTISAALARNLDRSLAARFSFIISIPAILGAGLIQSKAIIKAGTLGIGVWPLTLGFLAALISGLLAIKLFMNIIQKTSLRYFAYYCLVIGVLVMIFLHAS